MYGLAKLQRDSKYSIACAHKYQGRNMIYGLKAQSPKYDWDQGSEERAQGSEEWDLRSQGFWAWLLSQEKPLMGLKQKSC